MVPADDAPTAPADDAPTAPADDASAASPDDAPAQQAGARGAPSGETLLYVFDPLCGWCHAFHPHVRHVAKQTGLPVAAITGGLFRGERIQPLSAYPYIAASLDDLERRTGARFGKAFRDAAQRGDYVVDSEAAGRAFVALRHLAPERALEAVGTLHEAVFGHALDVREPPTVAWCARRMGLDEGQAIARFLRDESAAERDDDFAAAQHLGVTGFPALILVRGGHGFLVATGFSSASDVLRRIEDARKRPLPE